jgi:hypothetical protein
MSWSYDPNNLNTTTASGRLNTVRLIVGDTDSSDELIQNEEISFALSQSNNNVYYAGSLACRLIAAKFSRLVDTTLDNAISAKYSTRAKQYQQLAIQIENQAKKASGKSIGVFAGGILKTDMFEANQDPTRVQPAFGVHQFDNVEAGSIYIPDDPNGV